MSHRILIVDDSPVIRNSLRSCIEQRSDWETCGEMVQKLHPDVIVLDLSMPVMNGFDAARQIRKIAPCARIILFTLHASPQLVEEALKVGVNEVASKAGDAGSSVIRAVHSLLAA